MIVRRRDSSPARRRGAFSLIETVAAITLTAVLFGTATTLTALLFRLERMGRDDLVATMSEGQLSAEVRSDVHAATGFELGEPPDRIRLDGRDSGTILYEVQGDDLVRTQQGPEDAARVERYRLRPGSVARWGREGADDPARLVLEIESPAGTGQAGGGGVVQAFRIEATLGRDHRFDGGSP